MTDTLRTDWTGVVEPAGRGSRPALAELYRRYKPALHAYVVRARGRIKKEPEDLLHDFYLEKLPAVLADADRARGKFRNYLLKSMKYFLLEQLRHQRAQKRDEGTTEPMLEEPADHSDPEQEFQRAWVRVIRDRAMRRLAEQVERESANRQREHARRREEHAAGAQLAHSGEVSDTLILVLVQDDLLHGERGAYGTYGTTAERLGMSLEAFKKRVQRLRRRYHDLVRAEIADTVLPESELEVGIEASDADAGSERARQAQIEDELRILITGPDAMPGSAQ
jgi:DNA-directed RNA polymerase specialized sigma24 family protein